MDSKGHELLKLMFKEGETICVSHNKYGYHSVPLEMVLGETVTQVSPDTARDFEYVNTDKLQLVALNPIKGFRNDASCTKFRNFLVEMDAGELKSQKEYITNLKMPYSACVFSGNKSLHFLISLSEDLPNEKVYRTLAEWILKIVTLADPNTKNPSRSIRIPGAIRGEKKQLLVDIPGKVTLNQLGSWLGKYPDLKPKEREARRISGTKDVEKVKPWARKLMIDGLDPNKGRNKQWFTIACEFALAGYSEVEATEIMAKYFQEDQDFKEREWLTAIRSAFKHIYDNRTGL